MEETGTGDCSVCREANTTTGVNQGIELQVVAIRNVWHKRRGEGAGGRDLAHVLGGVRDNDINVVMISHRRDRHHFSEFLILEIGKEIFPDNLNGRRKPTRIEVGDDHLLFRTEGAVPGYLDSVAV